MLRIDSHTLTPALALRTDMDRFFSDLFGNTNDSGPTVGGRRGHPSLDVWEENDDYFVAIDVPGLSQSDVQITAVGRELTLEGGAVDSAAIQEETPEEQSSTQPTYFHRERNHLSFQRVIRFPFEIDVEHVEGSLQEGVLTIRIPKAASAKPRQIKIQTS